MVVMNTIRRHAESKSCLYFGWKLLIQVLTAFLSNLTTIFMKNQAVLVKLDSRIFQNNALGI